jgi:hypothetical protein
LSSNWNLFSGVWLGFFFLFVGFKRCVASIDDVCLCSGGAREREGERERAYASEKGERA